MINYLERAKNTKNFRRRPATHLTVELPINCKIWIMLRDEGVTKKSISYGLIMLLVALFLLNKRLKKKLNQDFFRFLAAKFASRVTTVLLSQKSECRKCGLKSK